MSNSGSFTEFGELVLLVGDFQVPFGKPNIPSVFKELLNTDKIKTVLCTGNSISNDVVAYLEQTSPHLFMARGDMDAHVTSRELPDHLTLEIGQFRVGLSHGHQIIPHGDRECLAATLRRLDVDILVSGFTCKNEIFQLGGKIFLNPGSISGCVNETVSPNAKSAPSFMLMAIQGNSAVVYVYELVDGKASVSLSEFTKCTSE